MVLVSVLLGVCDGIVGDSNLKSVLLIFVRFVIVW